MVDNIEERYFDWMVGKIGGRREHGMLLRYLFITPFVYIFPMDGNRYEDGIDLRYRFGAENDISRADIARNLDYTDCSLLEMMVALALRCEEHIMANDDYGDRTYIWFWAMIDSLNLLPMTDAHFDEDRVRNVICRLYNREYAADGDGGCFKVKNPKSDMRYLEIWDQAMVYLNEVLDAEEQF